MKVFLSQPLADRPENLIRRAGYAEHRDPHSPVMSYTRRLGQEFYPRFHVYLEQRENGAVFNLHLDQRRPSYGGGTHAHGGEYDGPVVEREGARLKEFTENYQSDITEKHKKGFFDWIFGQEDD